MIKLLISIALLVVSAFFNIKLYIDYQQSADLLKKCEKKYNEMLASNYENAEKIEQAKADALIQLHRADYQLLTAPAIEGDDCGSAKVRMNNWLEEREKDKTSK